MPFGKPNTMLTFKSVKNSVKGDKLSLNQKIDFFFSSYRTALHFSTKFMLASVLLVGIGEKIP